VILIITSQLNAPMRMVFEDLIRAHCSQYAVYEIDKPDRPLSEWSDLTKSNIHAVIAMGRKAIAAAKEAFKDMDIPKRAIHFLPLEIIGSTSVLDALLTDNLRRQTFIQVLEELRELPKADINTLPAEQVFPPELLELGLDELAVLLNKFFSQGKPYVVTLPDGRNLAIVPKGNKPAGFDYLFTVSEAIVLIQAHQLFKARPLAIIDRYGARLPLEEKTHG
jgi:hypothetical protein